MQISATNTITAASILSECADLIESMLHRFLKTESQKPSPPTPTELQPAVNTLWRLSTIRKNLAQKPSPSSQALPPVHPADPVILSNASSDPTAKQIAKLALDLQREVRARLDLQTKNNSPAPAHPSPPHQLASASPPVPASSQKFRYPPPTRTSV